MQKPNYEINSVVRLLETLSSKDITRIRQQYPDVNLSSGRILGGPNEDNSEVASGTSELRSAYIETTRKTLERLNDQGTDIAQYISIKLNRAALLRSTSVYLALAISGGTVGAITSGISFAPIIAGLALLTNFFAAGANYMEYGHHHKSANPVDNLKNMTKYVAQSGYILIKLQRLDMMKDREADKLLLEANDISAQVYSLILDCGYKPSHKRIN